MANTDPLERYRELISEAWEVASSLRYAAKTRQLVLEDMRKVVFAEGRVVGYLEALTLTAPDLAEEAAPSTSELMSDLTDLRKSITDRLPRG